MSAVTLQETPARSQAAAAQAGVRGTPREVLSFKLGAEEYCIDILKVQEIRGYEPPTRIANAPEFNGSIAATHITGLGTVTSGDTERMLILMDIEQMLSSADMGLMDDYNH